MDTGPFSLRGVTKFSFFMTDKLTNAQRLKLEKWQDARVREAMTSADRGEGIPHAEVSKWVASLGTKKPLPMPKI
jgi:predicted transcriptional regulator